MTDHRSNHRDASLAAALCHPRVQWPRGSSSLRIMGLVIMIACALWLNQASV